MSAGSGAAKIGRYEVIKAIASGGMATVYLGRVVGAGGFERLVAIKSMHPHIQEDPEFVAMFLDEARLAARVRHPNVVPTIDVQESPLFLVMEYVEGPSIHAILRTLRKKGEELPVGIALRVIVDALGGLHAAHELKGADGQSLQLVHRDVSPQNILVGIDGVTRITDFGVARAESRLSSTRGGQVKGKIGYMAPEQVRSEPADRRSDTYAAAVVLWELLAGAPLFMADNEGALVAQVAMGAMRAPREVEPSVPEALDAVCMRALALDPGERFPTAADFVDAIEEAARAAGVAIASARSVAAFVSGLGAHESPDAPARPSARPLPAWSLQQPGAPAAPPRGSLSSGAGSTSAVLTQTFDDDEVRPPTSPRPWWSIPVVSVAISSVIVGVVWLALRGGPEPGSASPGVPAPSSSSPAVTASAPTAPPTDPAQLAAAPSASVSSTASSSLPPSVASGAPTVPNARGSGALPSRPGPPAGRPTSFRPSGL